MVKAGVPLEETKILAKNLHWNVGQERKAETADQYLLLKSPRSDDRTPDYKPAKKAA